jgi:hypothetical protein
VPETLGHVFTCPSPNASDNRHNQQDQLRKSLEQLGTPDKMVHAMLQGLTKWESFLSSNTHKIRVPFRGTVLHADCTLVQAFMEHSDVIGWEHFLRGRISSVTTGVPVNTDPAIAAPHDLKLLLLETDHG